MNPHILAPQILRTIPITTLLSSPNPNTHCFPKFAGLISTASTSLNLHKYEIMACSLISCMAQHGSNFDPHGLLALILDQSLPPEGELFGEVHVHFTSRKTSLNSSVTMYFINIKSHSPLYILVCNDLFCKKLVSNEKILSEKIVEHTVCGKDLKFLSSQERTVCFSDTLSKLHEKPQIHIIHQRPQTKLPCPCFPGQPCQGNNPSHSHSSNTIVLTQGQLTIFEGEGLNKRSKAEVLILPSAEVAEDFIQYLCASVPVVSFPKTFVI